MSQTLDLNAECPDQFTIKAGRILQGGTKVPAMKFIKVHDLGGAVYKAKLYDPDTGEVVGIVVTRAMEK